MTEQSVPHDALLRVEAQHRVRNTLAVVRSLVRRTAQSATSVEEFEQHLDGRLAALARLQSHLVRDLEGHIDLELIVRDELLAHAAGNADHIGLAGPEARLPARIAETFTLAVHELVTNAVKYGALADPTGRIAIRWSVERGADGAILDFAWHERIAALATPTRRGFGSELLEQVMRYELDAEPELAFAADGLRYSVRLPLPEA